MRGIRTLLLTDACLRGGAENDGHENAGLWTCFRCLNRPTWNRLRFNRLLLRFQECSRSKNKLKTIRLYSCLLGLPLLPADDISPAFDEVKLAVSSDSRFVSKLNDLLRYAGRQWIQKRSIGPARLCVRDNRNRTNNILESFHAALRRRIQVSHPNLFTFLGHLQHVTTESTHDMARLTNGLRIKRAKKKMAKKKMNLINERRSQEVYTIYFSAVTCILPLFWKELHTAL